MTSSLCINVDIHLDLVRANSLALWNATFSHIINASVSQENRVNNTMKWIFLKLKYNVLLFSYIHYIHFEAFEFYMPTIACSKVLTCDSSLKELTLLTEFSSCTEISSLPNLSALFSFILFANSIKGIPLLPGEVSLCFQYFFDNICQGFFFMWALNITFITTRVYWGCICDLMCSSTLFTLWYTQAI